MQNMVFFFWSLSGRRVHLAAHLAHASRILNHSLQIAKLTHI